MALVISVEMFQRKSEQLVFHWAILKGVDVVVKDHVNIKAKVKTAFVHSLCYLNRPNKSKTHRSDDLFINAPIMQLN